MIEKLKDRFLKFPLNVDLDLIDQIKLDQNISWQKIELIYAINGKEVTMDDYLFFLIGSGFYKKIYNMMVKCISKTNFLNHLVNSVDSIEACYILGIDDLYWTSKIAWQWFTVNNNTIDKSFPTAKYSPLLHFEDDLDNKSGIEIREKRKFKLLDAIDKRFPLLLVQFFDKYKKEIVLKDKSLVQFILQRTSIRAKKDRDFEKIYNMMDSEIKKIRNIGTFLN